MNRLQANKNCNIIEFTDIMHKLLISAWSKDWGTFCEAFPNGTDPENVKSPLITYQVISKIPATMGNSTREIKPRYRDTILLPNVVDGGPEAVNIYAQSFDYLMEFKIWEENNTKADLLAERFEDFMMIYAGYFLSEGVQQLIFIDMNSVDRPTMIRDRIVCRNFRYRVRIEKHVEIPTSVIKEVIARVSAEASLHDDQDQSIEALEFKSNKGGNS
jgi:hypothetical protein